LETIRKDGKGRAALARKAYDALMARNERNAKGKARGL
jgi:hypothetical protein